jgi:hypothetical protein
VDKVESNLELSLSEMSPTPTNMTGTLRFTSVPSDLNNWQPARESSFMNSKSRSTKI